VWPRELAHARVQLCLAPTPRARAQPAGGGHAAICAAAERHFRAIREAVAARGAPATLKAGFLAPLSRDLPAELAVHVFARTDADFMGLFVGARARPLGHRRVYGRTEGLTGAQKGFWARRQSHAGRVGGLPPWLSQLGHRTNLAAVAAVLPRPGCCNQPR